MRKQSKAALLERHTLVLAGVVLSGLFWIFESWVHVIVFEDGSLAEAIFTPEPHEIWMRLTVIAMFMIFAVTSNWMLGARRQAQEEATCAKVELDQIFDTAADGMRVVDRDFTVRRANDTFAAMVGLTKQTIIGKKCHEVLRGHLCDTPGCPLTRVLQNAERIEYDAEKLRPDGKTIPCIVTATPFRGPSGEVVGIVEDFKDITERKHSEMELKDSREQLRKLASHLQDIREEERKRIAREIHDEFGQSLAALNLDVHWLKRRLPGEEAELRAKTKSMADLIAATAESVRNVCSELRPTILDDVGLSAAIEWQAGEFAKRTGIVCGVFAEPEEIVADQGLSVAVFRIFQEALTNVVRHAGASAVDVRLISAATSLSLRVSDNGRGVNNTRSRTGKSFGLIGVQERVRDFGGTVTISEVDSGGTRLEVVIPKSAHKLHATGFPLAEALEGER